jgi:DNA primase
MTQQSDEPTSGSPWIDVNEVKRLVPMESVLERYGVLSGLKGGGSQRSGRSPFREDTKPSFSVNLEKGIWNDLGGRPCGPDGRPVPGNLIGLVMAFEKCSFREALVFLQTKFVEGQKPEEAAASEARGKVQEALRQEDAEADENEPFGQELKGLRTAKIPYFEQKGITEETVVKFGAGYCSRGLMKSRVVFPIRDRSGQVLAYAGRAVREDQEKAGGKYRFPNGFRKHLELFNIDRIAGDAETKKAVRDFGIILVEGFSDVLKLCQHGFLNCVALMGTNFFEAQKEMLTDPALNPTRRVTLFLDNDEAGRAGQEAAAKALTHEAFARCVDYGRVNRGDAAQKPSEPEHFTKDELRLLLSLAGPETKSEDEPVAK